MGDFKGLRAWQEARHLVLVSAKVIKKLPPQEKFEAILELVDCLEYLPKEEIAEVKTRRANCARMVYGLIRRFK